jgi:hypothetical protein
MYGKRLPGSLLASRFFDWYSAVPVSWNLRRRKWGKTKEKVGAGCEASTCFMARDVSEKCQSQIHRPPEHLAISVANVTDVLAQEVVAEPYTLARRTPIWDFISCLRFFRISRAGTVCCPLLIAQLRSWHTVISLQFNVKLDLCSSGVLCISESAVCLLAPSCLKITPCSR